MPSTSGRAASHPRRADKLKFFHELKALRDRLKVERGLVKTADSDYNTLGTGSQQVLADDGSKEQPNDSTAT